MLQNRRFDERSHRGQDDNEDDDEQVIKDDDRRGGIFIPLAFLNIEEKRLEPQWSLPENAQGVMDNACVEQYNAQAAQMEQGSKKSRRAKIIGIIIMVILKFFAYFYLEEAR